MKLKIRLALVCLFMQFLCMILSFICINHFPILFALNIGFMWLVYGFLYRIPDNSEDE
jgi:hypothetical protein